MSQRGAVKKRNKGGAVIMLLQSIWLSQETSVVKIKHPLTKLRSLRYIVELCMNNQKQTRTKERWKKEN